MNWLEKARTWKIAFIAKASSSGRAISRGRGGETEAEPGWWYEMPCISLAYGARSSAKTEEASRRPMMSTEIFSSKPGGPPTRKTRFAPLGASSSDEQKSRETRGESWKAGEGSWCYPSWIMLGRDGRYIEVEVGRSGFFG